MAQEIEQVAFPDRPQTDIFDTSATPQLATTLAAVGSDNGFQIPFQGLKQILIHNPTSADALITIKAQTPDGSVIRRYFNYVINDYTMTIEAGKVGCIKPHGYLRDTSGNVVIEANALVTIIPLRDWVVEA